MIELKGGGAAVTVLWVTLAGCAYGGSGRERDAATQTPDARAQSIGDASRAERDGGSRADGSVAVDAATDAGRADAGRPDSGTPNACAETPCRVAPPQCGCAAGQGCYVDDANAIGCQASGTLREGQVCSGPFSCAPGLQCTGDGGRGAVCLRFCTTDTDCPGGDGAVCAIELSDGSGGTLPARLCSIDCDPVRSAGCATGSACLAVGGSRAYSTCRSAGAGAVGARCSAHTDCGPRLVCVDTGSGGRCRNYCVDSLDCPGLLEDCYPFSSPPQVIGGVTYGFCY